MTSLPLDVHQVLEEEYVSMYGPLERPTSGVDYTHEQILDRERVCEILNASGKDLETTLNDLIAAGDLSTLADSNAITPRGLELLRQYDELEKLAEQRDPVWGKRELRRTILDEALHRLVQPLRDVRLDNLYANVHERAGTEPRTALCISGGGIRSATFALGVIQGLASAGILKKFDYLSTVSGGGYIGSWLSSWVRRHPEGVTGVQEELHASDTAIAGVLEDGRRSDRNLPATNIDPEPAPVRHLRDYSNYLSPRLGILSADSWTLASHYVRNLLLNLLVLVPLLAVALAIPRFFSWGLTFRHEITDPGTYLWIALAFVTIAFACIGAARPVERGAPAVKNRLSSNKGYLIGIVLPLVAAACAVAMYWARVAEADDKRLSRWHGLGAALAMVAVPWAVYYGRMVFLRKSAAPRSGASFVGIKMLSELFAVSMALVTSGVLFWLLAKKIFPEPMLPTPNGALMSPLERITMSSSPQAQLFTCFAVPLALLVFFVQASIFVGLSGRRNEDADREWWARGGALLLMVSIGMAVFSAISVFGPVALYHAPAILGSIGGLAGVIAAVLGFSDKTPANQKQKEKAGTAATIGNVSSAVLIPLFVIFILAAISFGSTWLIHEIGTSPVDEKAMARQLAMQYEHSLTREGTAGPIKAETKASLPPGPFTTLAGLRTYAHLQTVQKTTGQQLMIFLLVGLGALILSRFISVNKFSMHALYRNRLIRAYLGASRHRRTPDRFTGFDEDDNLQMWELRPEIFWPRDIQETFAADLRKGVEDKDELALYIWEKLDAKTQKALGGKTLSDTARDMLVQDLNRLVLREDLGQAIGEQPPTAQNQIGPSLAHRNRELLERHFPAGLVPMRRGEERGPLHVINTALNLTTGENLGWQQRMAESFTVSPLHSGSLYVGYRKSEDYGGPRGISLGTAVTISGAAASPNMGYHSSPTMAFLMTMFNVRLGSWLGNPGVHGQKSYGKAHPTSNLRPLVHELTGGSNDRARWIYLSDGGHFENLGVYEMVLRRCHYIVVSDAGADPKFSFEDLGNAIRKIRTDLGVPVDIYDIDMTPRGSDGQFGEGRFVARATIRYSTVDKGGRDGTLIYIKTGIYKNDQYLPRDVYNYAQESLAFPHEPTSDQFFSESQFESYRALGRHAVNDICANYTPDTTISAKPYTPRIPVARRYTSLDQFDAAVRARISPAEVVNPVQAGARYPEGKVPPPVRGDANPKTG
ncbi:MAG TPA: patatin-like phospholipase family protein [Thermoanaerobaculia bacterium]|jgi:hypothetical protein